MHYAPIEGQALALLFALESCRIFVPGYLNLIFAVDHLRIVGIFSNCSLNDIPNPSLLEIQEKTMTYRFHVIAIPGNKNLRADAISHIPL